MDGGGSSLRFETFTLETGGVGEGVSNGGLGSGLADCMFSERASWMRCSARHVIEFHGGPHRGTSAWACILGTSKSQDDLSLNPTTSID